MQDGIVNNWYFLFDLLCICYGKFGRNISNLLVFQHISKKKAITAAKAAPEISAGNICALDIKRGTLLSGDAVLPQLKLGQKSLQQGRLFR